MTIPARPAFLNSAQVRFLTFHTTHLVTSWRWHFLGTQLRACTGGECCTIWKDDLQQLLVLGLMRAGHGVAVEVTELGRDVAAEKECV